jgi:hypothetical protein
MIKYNKNYSYIIIILISFFFIYLGIRFINGLLYTSKNGFSNLDSLNPGKYPQSDDLPILTDTYPYTGSKKVSNKSYNDIWWEYPIFKEGSYKQITNNLRYYKNPDEGTCIRADFCNALYDNKKVKSNYILPLPPLSMAPDGNARVNYYWSHPNKLLQPNPDFVLKPNYPS